MTSRPAAVVVADRVTKAYRHDRETTVALPPTSIVLTAGELVVVTGASKSGKTTLVNILAGWEQPDGGRVEWPSTGAAAPGWPDVAVVPQALSLLDELTVAENITLPHRVSGRIDWRAALVEPAMIEMLDALDVARLRHRTTDQISVGERQRVMVARALAIGPAAILADEPTAHQDEVHAAAVLGQLRVAVEAGAACVIVTRTTSPAIEAHRTIALAELADLATP